MAVMLVYLVDNSALPEMATIVYGYSIMPRNRLCWLLSHLTRGAVTIEIDLSTTTTQQREICLRLRGCFVIVIFVRYELLMPSLANIPFEGHR